MVQRYKGTSDLEEENLQHKKAFYNLVDNVKKTPVRIWTSLQGNHMRMVFSTW